MDTVTEELRKTVLEEARRVMLEGCRDPMSAIVDTVFSFKESRELGWDELDGLIRRTYLKTKGKLGILDPLIEDGDVTEIMVNGKDRIFYEKNGKIERYGLSFDTTEDLEEVIRNIAGSVHREINELNPIVDARLEDGSRVNGVYKNVAMNGPILTIRKFSGKYITMEDLVGNGTVTAPQAEFLRALVESGYNLFISGGTSSGKTTLLNALSDYVPKEERVIVIEDSMVYRRGHHGGSDQDQPEDETGQDHRWGGQRRRGGGHASGHEHGAFRLHVHRSRQLCGRHAEEAGVHVSHGRVPERGGHKSSDRRRHRRDDPSGKGQPEKQAHSGDERSYRI